MISIIRESKIEETSSRKQPDLRGVTKRIRQAAQWTDSLELLRPWTAC